MAINWGSIQSLLKLAPELLALAQQFFNLLVQPSPGPTPPPVPKACGPLNTCNLSDADQVKVRAAVFMALCQHHCQACCCDE